VLAIPAAHRYEAVSQPPRLTLPTTKGSVVWHAERLSSLGSSPGLVSEGIPCRVYTVVYCVCVLYTSAPILKPRCGLLYLSCASCGYLENTANLYALTLSFCRNDPQLLPQLCYGATESLHQGGGSPKKLATDGGVLVS